VSYDPPGEDSWYSTHRYGLRHVYDRNGRDTLLVHPKNLASSDSLVVYEYYGWGALEQVAGLQDGDYEFHYDSAGRLDSLSYPGGAWTKYTYDNDGRLMRRHTRSASDSLLQADTLTYDRRGKLVRGERLAGSDVTNVYTGLGHLAASEWWLAMSWKLDEWTVNALEENYEARFSNYAEPAVNYVYTYNGNGQLESCLVTAVHGTRNVHPWAQSAATAPSATTRAFRRCRRCTSRVTSYNSASW
jgi:YD repeat-containing protein